MKIRIGFVSNSSSSSYTCDVCGFNESGMDLCLSDLDMSSCVNGHEFCNDHAPEWKLTWEDKREIALDTWYLTSGGGKHLRPAVEAAQTALVFNHLVEEHELEWLWEEAESGYEVPSKGCPICAFGNAHKEDGFLYLLKVAGRTEADLLAELKEKFGSYKEMKQWLKE